MTRITLGDRLDDLSRRSGLYRLTLLEPASPRNLRWQPLLVMAAMPMGYALLVLTIHGPHRSFGLAMAGALLLFGSLAAVHYLRFFGPRLTPGPSTTLDERDLMLKARAGQYSGTIMVLVAILGCFYMGLAQFFALWTPHDTLEWIYAGLILQGWAITLPVLVASWLQPRDMPDED